MARRAWISAAAVLVLVGVFGGCPQDALLDATPNANDPNVAASETPAAETPRNERPGVNPLAPMPVIPEYHSLRSADHWVDPFGNVGWYSNPADGIPIPGPGEITVTPAQSADTARTSTYGNRFASVEAAVEFAARQFDAVAHVYGLFGELGNPKFWVEPLTYTQWGRCPHVQLLSGETTTIVSLGFGEGCSGPSTGGEIVVGFAGQLVYQEPTPAAAYVTSNLTIDGRSIIPHLVHPRIHEALPVLMSVELSFIEGVQLEGPCDFETSGVGRAAGDAVVDIRQSYVFEYVAADFEVGDLVHSLDLQAHSVRVRPAAHVNFVPDVGELEFPVVLPDGAHYLSIVFSADSPTTGVVSVSVDNSPPIDLTLPADLLD